MQESDSPKRYHDTYKQTAPLVLVWLSLNFFSNRHLIFFARIAWCENQSGWFSSTHIYYAHLLCKWNNHASSLCIQWEKVNQQKFIVRSTTRYKHHITPQKKRKTSMYAMPHARFQALALPCKKVGILPATRFLILSAISWPTPHQDRNYSYWMDMIHIWMSLDLTCK
jgi:hypothetical protein